MADDQTFTEVRFTKEVTMTSLFGQGIPARKNLQPELNEVNPSQTSMNNFVIRTRYNFSDVLLSVLPFMGRRTVEMSGSFSDYNELEGSVDAPEAFSELEEELELNEEAPELDGLSVEEQLEQMEQNDKALLGDPEGNDLEGLMDLDEESLESELIDTELSEEEKLINEQLGL